MFLNTKLRNTQYCITVIVFVVISMSMSPNLIAQGFYISGSAGYSFGTNNTHGTYFNQRYVERSGFSSGFNGIELTNENVPFSLGKGFNIDINGGYTFNDFLGAEVGVSYLLGGETQWLNEGLYDVKYSNGEEVSSVIRKTTKAQSQMWRVVPTIVFSSWSEGKFNPYLKLGAILGFGSFTFDYEEINSKTGANGYNEIILKSTEYSGGMAFGFSGTVGVNYSVNEKVIVFTEARYTSMNYSPNQSKVTNFTVNGDDVLDGKTTNETEVTFVDRIDPYLPVQNPDEPFVKLKETFNMSSLGFNVGVKYNF